MENKYYKTKWSGLTKEQSYSLSKIEENFIFIKGDYKEQVINTSKIIKISKEVDDDIR